MRAGLWATLLLALALPGTARAQGEGPAVVRSVVANVRSGPGKENTVIRKYRRCTPVSVLERNGNWRRVRDEPGNTGWMHTVTLIEGGSCDSGGNPAAAPAAAKSPSSPEKDADSQQVPPEEPAGTGDAARDEDDPFAGMEEESSGGDSDDSPADEDDPFAGMEDESSGGDSDDPFAGMEEGGEESSGGDDDPFGGMDGSGEEESSLLKTLKDGFEGQAWAAHFGHFYDNNNEEERDTRHHLTDVGLKWKLELTGSGNIFNTNGWVNWGSGKDNHGRVVTPFRDTDRARNYIQISEFYYTREFPSVDLTLGKKKVEIGISTLYSPSKRINAEDLNDPGEPRTSGVWQMGAEANLWDATVTLVCMPSYDPTKYPSNRSRWAGSGSGDASEGNTNFNYETPDGLTFHNDSIKPSLGNTQALLMVKRTVKGWDLFAAGFRIISRQSVLKELQPVLPVPVGIFRSENYLREQFPVYNAAGGFSTVYKKLELHGETLFQGGSRRRDDDYINSVLGFTYKFDDYVTGIGLNGLSVDGEYAWENIIGRQNSPGYIKSSINSRSGRDTYMGRITVTVNDDLRMAAAFVYDHVDGGQSEVIGGEYKFGSGLKLKTGVEFYNGKGGSSLGIWRRNDRVSTKLEYTF